MQSRSPRTRHALEMETGTPTKHSSHSESTTQSEDDAEKKTIGEDGDEEDVKPLLVVDEGKVVDEKVPTGSCLESMQREVRRNPEFFSQAALFAACFCGLQASYLTWGYMQELIMTSQYTPTERVPDGKFPSAAFCVFSNRMLAVVVAMIVVKIRKGAVFANNVAPTYAFCPPALSNTISSWSQYASLKYVSFPEQAIFKSCKIIAVMLMGKVLQSKSYPWTQYFEAFLITVGVAIFSLASYTPDRDSHTELIGLFFLCMYISFDSFTSQYQDKVYKAYGRENVDPFQMMLGVNITAICMTTGGLLISGDFPVVFEFLRANPAAAWYNLLTAITSASGQISIFYTIKHFGPIVFTIIMTTRQMLSICLSAFIFGHKIGLQAIAGALLVFGVVFFRIYQKYRGK